MLCIAGLDAIRHERPTLHILWAASDNRWDHLYVNYFTYWTAMHGAVPCGIHLVDLGTSRFGSTQHAFKHKWKPVFYAVQEHGAPTSDPADRKTGRVLSAIWRRSPTWFADGVGPQLRKYLI